jgi:hypothetical protein
MHIRAHAAGSGKVQTSHGRAANDSAGTVECLGAAQAERTGARVRPAGFFVANLLGFDARRLHHGAPALGFTFVEIRELGWVPTPPIMYVRRRCSCA